MLTKIGFQELVLADPRLLGGVALDLPGHVIEVVIRVRPEDVLELAVQDAVGCITIMYLLCTWNVFSITYGVIT